VFDFSLTDIMSVLSFILLSMSLLRFRVQGISFFFVLFVSSFSNLRISLPGEFHSILSPVCSLTNFFDLLFCFVVSVFSRYGLCIDYANVCADRENSIHTNWTLRVENERERKLKLTKFQMISPSLDALFFLGSPLASISR